MNKICTSIEQSKKLIELGIDINTADMFWDLLDGDEPDEKIPNCYWDRFDITINEFVPAWSLSTLLKFLKPYGYSLSTAQSNKNIITVGNKTLCFYDTPIDAAFEMVCWLLKK